MNIEFSVEKVRALKGAPLSCFVLLTMQGNPVMASWLESMSGYSDKSVQSALTVLLEYGLVTRNGRYEWQIAEGVRQLPLGSYLPEVDGAATQEEPQNSVEVASGTKFLEVASSPAAPRNDMRNRGEPEILRVSSSSSSLTSFNKNHNLPLLDATDPEKLRVEENRQACERFGIFEPKRTHLSHLVHVSKGLIEYHCATAPNIAMAIARIERNWAIKAGWKPQVELVAAEAEEPMVMVQADPVLQERWSAAQKELKPKLRKADFSAWIEPLIALRMDGEVIVLGAGNEFAAKWVSEHALAEVESVLGASVRVTVIGKEEM